MSNGEVCCLLGVCCPPASVKRRSKVSAVLAREIGLEISTAEQVLDWFDSRVDFAPKGSASLHTDAVVQMARAHRDDDSSSQ